MAQSETVLVTAPAGSLTAVRPEPTRISLRDQESKTLQLRLSTPKK